MTKIFEANDDESGVEVYAVELTGAEAAQNLTKNRFAVVMRDIDADRLVSRIATPTREQALTIAKDWTSRF